MIISHKYSDKWTKIGVDIGIGLGNNLSNFQLHRLTRRENTAKSFRGLLFDSQCILYIFILKHITSGGFRHVQHVRPNRGPTKKAPQEEPKLFAT